MPLEGNLFIKGGILMFCNNCGKEINSDSVFCGSCGNQLISNAQPSVQPRVQIESSGAGLAIFLSILFGITALFFLPPLFGGLGVFFGFKVKQKGNEGLGIALMVVNGACLLIGMFLGVLSFSLL